TVRLQVTETLKVLDASFTVDTAIARAYRGGVEAFLRLEGMSHLRAAFFKLEQQIINGTNADATGFDGLADQLDNIGTYVLGQGGTTALSSVYLVRTMEEDFAVVAGNDGNIDIEE